MTGRSRSSGAPGLVRRVLLGSIFTLPGLLVVGVGTGVIEVDPSTVHAPYWLIAGAGGMFVLAGAWLFGRGTRVEPVLQAVAGPALLVGLLGMLHWVAFGPGVRSCSGGLSLPFVSTRRAVGDLECRLAFGVGALLFDGVLVSALLSRWAEKRLTGTARRWVDGVSKGVLVLALAPLIPLFLVALAGKAALGRVRGG